MPGRPGASTPRRTPRLSRRPLKVNATVPSACSAASPMDRAWTSRLVTRATSTPLSRSWTTSASRRREDPRDEPARELDVADLALRHRHTGRRPPSYTVTESGRALSGRQS